MSLVNIHRDVGVSGTNSYAGTAGSCMEVDVIHYLGHFTSEQNYLGGQYDA